MDMWKWRSGVQWIPAWGKHHKAGMRRSKALLEGDHLGSNVPWESTLSHTLLGSAPARVQAMPLDCPCPLRIPKSLSLVCYSPKASASVCAEEPFFLLLAWRRNSLSVVAGKRCQIGVPASSQRLVPANSVKARVSQDISWEFVLIFWFVLWEGPLFKDQPIFIPLRAAQAPKTKRSSFYRASGIGWR